MHACILHVLSERLTGVTNIQQSDERVITLRTDAAKKFQQFSATNQPAALFLLQSLYEPSDDSSILTTFQPTTNKYLNQY